MDGCYGAFINTDTYTVGGEKEIWAAIKLYEIACRTPSMRHWIFSNLDYGSKVRSSFTPIVCFDIDDELTSTSIFSSRDTTPIIGQSITTRKAWSTTG